MINTKNIQSQRKSIFQLKRQPLHSLPSNVSFGTLFDKEKHPPKITKMPYLQNQSRIFYKQSEREINLNQKKCADSQAQQVQSFVKFQYIHDIEQLNKISNLSFQNSNIKQFRYDSQDLNVMSIIKNLQQQKQQELSKVEKRREIFNKNRQKNEPLSSKCTRQISQQRQSVYSKADTTTQFFKLQNLPKKQMNDIQIQTQRSFQSEREKMKKEIEQRKMKQLQQTKKKQEAFNAKVRQLQARMRYLDEIFI